MWELNVRCAAENNKALLGNSNSHPSTQEMCSLPWACQDTAELQHAAQPSTHFYHPHAKWKIN